MSYMIPQLIYFIGKNELNPAAPLQPHKTTQCNVGLYRVGPVTPKI